ncbi:Rrf2 family transcriptional regulator [Candidatus Bipolaricaulota bacterium]|nr:Rrf2 family transcriptional regulator [Candidatus Bipolaricaulota bacterium]
MIRIPTQGRYALRTMVDVGQHQAAGPVLRQDAAARQAISANYVAQICRKLVAAGLLKGIKGPGGGYVLGKSPEAISAGDILHAIEGPLALVHCVLEDDETPCNRTEACVAHRLWARVTASMEAILDATTLRSLIDEADTLEREAL